MFNMFKRNRSKEQVKDRLQLVLQYDRAKLTPGKMEDLKQELLDVIKKHFPKIDEGASIDLAHDGDRVTFTADLPVRD